MNKRFASKWVLIFANLLNQDNSGGMKTFFVLVSISVGATDLLVVPHYENYQTREDCEQELLKRLDEYEGQWIAQGELGKTLYMGYGTNVGGDIATAKTCIEIVTD